MKRNQQSIELLFETTVILLDWRDNTPNPPLFKKKINK
jgi:hypothetical protein